MRDKSKEKGVTLVALGVTVVVLMIVASITISMLTSDHGIVDEATNAQMQTEVSKLQETVDIYVRSNTIKRRSAKDLKKYTMPEELNGIVTEVNTNEDLYLGVFKSFKEVDFQTKFGKGGKDIKENWTGNMLDLQDCFAIDFATNDIYYIVDGRIWRARGQVSIEEVIEYSKNEGQKPESPKPTESATPSTKPTESAEPSEEPTISPTTSTEPTVEPTESTESSTTPSTDPSPEFPTTPTPDPSWKDGPWEFEGFIDKKDEDDDDGITEGEIKDPEIDEADPNAEYDGVFTKQITVNRKIYKNQAHADDPITAKVYRTKEKLQPATVELGTANNATITQDENGESLDAEVQAQPRFWTTSEEANAEDTTSSNNDNTKDETAVALNGKAHLTKDATYYMLYKYTSKVTYNIPEASGEGETTEEKEREIYVNANGNMDKQEAEMPEQPTVPSTWQPTPESWQWNGWNKEEIPSEKVVTPEDIVEGEITLYASFKREITIKFDADGGEAESVPEAITAQSYKNAINEVPAKATIPEKTPIYEERNFLHWTDKAELESQTYEKNQEYEFTEDKTLYAVWDNMGVEVDPNVKPDNPEKVIKYKIAEGVEEEWLPFYNDGTYNYIISKNYIDPQVEGVLNSSSGLKYGNNDSYLRGTWWGGGAPSCEGQPQNNNVEDIKTTGFWKRYEFNNTSNANSKMAYSFLNKEWWTQYKGEYGADAIGTATLEMYATAYNARYKDKNIAWNNGANGLNITNSNWSDGGFLDTSDNTFVIEESNQCEYCWLASPYYDRDNCLWLVDCDGNFNYGSNSGNNFGLRPVIQLKRGTKIIDKIDHYELEYSEPKDIIPNEFGEEVENVVGNITEWKAFYNDGSSIYLITKDYIPNDSLPQDTAIKPTTSNNTNYRVYFPNVPNTKLDILPNIQGTDVFLNKWFTMFNKESENDNAKYTADMLNTSDNYWGKFKGEYGAEAIAGPTLELFAASWNAKYPNNKLTIAVNNEGYTINGDISSVDIGTEDSLYVIKDTSKCSRCYFASPGAFSSLHMVDAFSAGKVNLNDMMSYNYCDGGLRPVVRLRPGVILEREENEKTKLIEDGNKLPKINIDSQEKWKKEVVVTIEYPEIEGVIKEYSYTGEKGDWHKYISPLKLTENKTVYAKSTLKNSSSLIVSLDITNIDSTPPTISEFKEKLVRNTSIKMIVEADDTQSQLLDTGAYTYYLDGKVKKQNTTENTYVYTDLQPEHEYKLKVEVEDTLGNKAELEKDITTSQNPVLATPSVDDYGKTLINESGGIDEWQVFHNDGEFYYIISTNNIINVPIEAQMTDKGNGKYSWMDEPNKKFSDVKGGTFKSKWFTKSFSDSNTSVKCAATLIDTDVWASFNGEYGEEAIGGPTWELFAASWNAYATKNGKEQMPTGYINSYGYLLKQNDSTSTRFIQYGTAKQNPWFTTTYWFASPSGWTNSVKYMSFANSDGQVYSGDNCDNAGLGIRPIIKLRKNVQFMDYGNHYELE